MKHGIKFWFKEKAESLCAKLERDILSDKFLKCKIVFGPVQSRRLGCILGINNLKPKVCYYNCIYCPSGITNCCSVSADYCLSPYALHLSVRNKLEELKRCGKNIDYIVFAGSGEPTLDSRLSKEILLLREFGYKIAVFTNSSLLWNNHIRENLMFADYVSVKIDTVNEETWLKLNRPHQRLNYFLILEGIKQFSKKFRGTLTTDTTLIKNINTNPDEMISLAGFLNKLNHKASYFTTPMFPPAEQYALSPDTGTLNQLSKIIKEKITNSVLLCCPETEDFFATGDFENELMGLIALHPVSIDAVNRFVKHNGKLQKLNEMISNGIVKEIEYRGKRFLKRNLTFN